MKSKIVALFFIGIGTLLSSSCGVYSFSGASTTASTIQVNLIYNNTELAPANLGANFTNELKDYLQRNSSLSIVEESPQLIIEGNIVQYQTSPLAPVASGSNNSNDRAALTRLTIGVRISYTDTIDPINSFTNQTFSFYTDFPNTQNLTDVQSQLEETIFDQILIDIFNATIANW